MPVFELEIIGEVPEGLDLEPTERVFSALVSSLDGAPDGIIDVMFVDDARSREANREYTGNDYATDVLSFSYIEDGGEPIDGVLGEMMVSLETAAHQAEAADSTLAEEVALLVLHGTLHVLGYDHQTLEQQEHMQALQRGLIGAAGYNYREFRWKE